MNVQFYENETCGDDTSGKIPTADTTIEKLQGS